MVVSIKLLRNEQEMYGLCSLYSDIYLSLISTHTAASLRQKQWLQKTTGYLQRINLSKCWVLADVVLFVSNIVLHTISVLNMSVHPPECK